MIWNNKDENIITYLMLLSKQLSGVTEKKRKFSVMTASRLGHSSRVSWIWSRNLH